MSGNKIIPKLHIKTIEKLDLVLDIRMSNLLNHIYLLNPLKNIDN